jgi:hypothetical protein
LFYRWTRDLHLYFGLFISPFLLVFSASVFFLNHAKVATDLPTSVDTFQHLQIPNGIDTARAGDSSAGRGDRRDWIHALCQDNASFYFSCLEAGI